MTLKVVGAGLGRTGTLSLKGALERLLGAPCYHMLELFRRPEHVPAWHAAARGRMPDWPVLLDGYAAAVDWPACAFWPELAAAFPDAIVLLSTRDPQSWWRSADRTIFPEVRADPADRPPAMRPWHEMVRDLMAARFTLDLDAPEPAIAAFERHEARVRAEVPAERLVEWRPGDGWAPLCAALGVAVPDEPFPHVNSTEEFLARRTASAGGTPD